MPSFGLVFSRRSVVEIQFEDDRKHYAMWLYPRGGGWHHSLISSINNPLYDSYYTTITNRNHIFFETTEPSGGVFPLVSSFVSRDDLLLPPIFLSSMDAAQSAFLKFRLLITFPSIVERHLKGCEESGWAIATVVGSSICQRFQQIRLANSC